MPCTSVTPQSTARYSRFAPHPQPMSSTAESGVTRANRCSTSSFANWAVSRSSVSSKTAQV